MNRLHPICYVVLAIVTIAARASADIRLPRIFSAHMMLQRDLQVPVWGWADPGEEVTVRFGEQEKKVTADRHGKWIVRLDPLTASDHGHVLKVTGKNEIMLGDVLIGDVWICSGQSNMEWPVSAALDAEKEIAAANFPEIRLFNVPGHTTSPLARDELPGGRWELCSPESVAGFSAVGYFFGRHLHRQAGVPIGLIGTNWGGTRIEPWTPPAGFRSVPELNNIAEQVNRFDPTVPTGESTWRKYVQEMGSWVREARRALESGSSLSPPATTPGFNDSGQPTAIYNSMVHGLAPYGVRGAIWYQGESNGEEGDSYFHKMQALINGWRQVWDQGEFPFYFYFVQLADFLQPNDDPAGGDGWARLREAQRRALSIDHTGMAVITDIGQADDIHPRNKQDVGKRLALWALRDAARQDVVVSGPLYRQMEVEGSHIRLHFDHIGSGLMVGIRKQALSPTEEDNSGKLHRFAIAGEDKQWQWADARIDGDTVIVSSDNVPQPVAVRYAHTTNPEGANLYNKEGLPASPFRTDDW